VSTTVTYADSKRDILLVALSAAPLDRLRLMKTAFLVWHRTGRPKAGPFHFEPYHYGPCAFDLYATLNELLGYRLIVQASPGVRWADYYLTEMGQREARDASRRLGHGATNRILETAAWASRQSFRSLLESVYSEAPDFATRSVLRREQATSS
jgi:hypothetical protein